MTEKVYLENPYLRQLDARITEKEYINDKYYIKLNKTIFYPNLAGGQPGDKGSINGVKVLDTYEEDNQIVHVLEENIHSDKVSLFIDWDNRLDYMQQHSGQHLLSSVFYKLFNSETVGFYIGKDHSYIDVNLPYLTETGIEKVEQFTSKIIFSNFSIKSYIIEKDEVDNLPIQDKAYNNSSIRIIEIDGIDFTPCCGTHLRSTGEIGLIKIKSFEKIKEGIRVEFVCGTRALDDYRIKNNYISNISNQLNCEIEDIVEKIDDFKEDYRKLSDENIKLKNELLKIRAEKVMTKKEIYKDINFINEDFDDLSIADIEEISKIILEEDNYIVFLNNTENEYNQYIFGLSNNLTDYLEDSFELLNKSQIDSHHNIFTGIDRDDKIEEIMKDYFNRIIKKL